MPLVRCAQLEAAAAEARQGADAAAGQLEAQRAEAEAAAAKAEDACRASEAAQAHCDARSLKLEGATRRLKSVSVFCSNHIFYFKSKVRVVVADLFTLPKCALSWSRVHETNGQSICVLFMFWRVVVSRVARVGAGRG